MRQGGGRALRLCLLLLCAGCGGEEGEARPEAPRAIAADSARAPAPAPGADRPEVMEGVLNLEGSREPMTYHLFRSPEGHPLSFSTYVPEDMRVEEVSSGAEQAVRFVAAFGGVPNEEMFVSARFPRTRLTTGEARARAREIADSLGRSEPGGEGPHPWALEWYRVRGAASRVATVALGRHRDRYFFVVTQHPAEAGDGFAPRAQRILDAWRWSEGGGLGT